MSGINKLTDRQIKNLKPGARRIKIGDGDKLWLFVSPSGIKVWRMLWKEGNTQKQFTIGPYPTISLKEAREKRDAVNGLLVQGLDPNEQYRSEQEQQDEETNLTFRVVAQEWYEKRTVERNVNGELTQMTLWARTQAVTLEPGHEYTEAILYTDQYGRQRIYPDTPLVYHEEDGTWGGPGRYTVDQDPSHWDF